MKKTKINNFQIGGDSGVTGSWSQTHWNLEVYDSTGDAYALLAGASGAALELRDTVSSEAVVLAANGGCNLYSYKAGNNIAFHNKPSGGSITERLRIDSAGLVGIGTVTPQRNVHIHQNTAANAYLHMTNSTTGATTTDGFSLYVATDGQTYYRARETRERDRVHQKESRRANGH